MSEGVPNLPTVTRPQVWRWLRSLPHVTLEFHEGGPRGKVSHARQAISLRIGMTRAERRDALLHELIHLERGPVGRSMKAKEEEQVRRQTARLALPDLDAIADALAWAHCPEEAAEELGVSVPVLAKRLAHLRPSEHGSVMAHLENR